MSSKLLRGIVVLTAFLGSFGVAIAQTPAPPKDDAQQSEADKAMERKSGQAGKEEPSSHATTVKPQDTAVFVNGALAVPNAPAESDTVPAKFSAKNAADDALITVAYTFKHFTGEQRNAIFAALKDQPVKSAFNADIGTELPLAIEVEALPDDLVAKFPETRGYQYAVGSNSVMLVAPANRIVVAAIPAVQELTTGTGGRTQ